MLVSIDTIVDDVKVCIDEIGPNDSEMYGSQDNLDMDMIISSKVVDALRFVFVHADISLLEADTVLTEEETSIDTEGVCSVVLPDNFLRLVYAKMKSWVRYLSEPIYWDDKEYATLKDPYATGTWERPKLAMVPNNTLELYKAKGTDDKAHVGIVTEPSIITDSDGKDKVNVNEKLYRALVYHVAGLTLLTYKDEHADSMFNQAMVIMGVQPKN